MVSNIIFKRKTREMSMIVSLVVLVLLWPQMTYAFMPPDFIFNIGSQVAQFFAAFLAITSLVAAVILRFIKTRIVHLKTSKKCWVFLFLIIFCVSSGVSYVYYVKKQKEFNRQWLEQTAVKQPEPLISNSNNLNISFDSVVSSTSVDLLQFTETNQAELIKNLEENDIYFLFDYGEYKNDKIAIFIVNIFNSVLVAKSELEASEVLEELMSLVEKSPHILVHKLVRISDNHSSMEIVAGKSSNYKRYGVVIETNNESEIVRVNFVLLSKALVPINNDKKLISVNEFDDILKNNREEYIFLEIRTEIDHSFGYLPGSINIRLADLRAGRWIEFLSAQTVIVLCQDGLMRSVAVAKYLNSKGIEAYLLKGGISAWGVFNGEWQGSYERNNKFTEKKHQRVIETKEIEELIDSGVVFIDGRSNKDRKDNHLVVGDFSMKKLEFMYGELTTIKLEAMIKQLADDKKFVMVCNDEKTCKESLTIGVTLDWYGNEFIGCYITPWELGDIVE